MELTGLDDARSASLLLRRVHRPLSPGDFLEAEGISEARRGTRLSEGLGGKARAMDTRQIPSPAPKKKVARQHRVCVRNQFFVQGIVQAQGMSRSSEGGKCRQTGGST